MNEHIINQAALSNAFLEGTFLGVKVNDYYLLMVFWNLFLLLIPFLLVVFLRWYWKKNHFYSISHKIIAIATGLLWFLFIPNSAYIMTDVRHLINFCPAGSLYDVCPENSWIIMFFFIYSLCGWVSMVYLLNQMRNFLSLIYGNFFSRIAIIIIIPFVSLGVLLGLLNRWNSWDLLFNINLVIKSSLVYLVNPVYIINWFVFTLSFYLLYFGGSYLFKKK